MKEIRSILALSSILLLLASCAKDGETGPQGPAGQDGTNGTDGNANVYSFNYGITQWGWDGNYVYSEIDDSDGLSISASDIANGALLAYIETSAGWSALPYPYPIGGGTVQFYRGFFDVNHFLIRVSNYDGSNPNPPALQASTSSPRNIKIVVIPQRIANPNINVYNYEEVKVAYNLKN
jgi:hypothetical protein